TDKTEMGPLARLLLGHNATHGECTRAPPDQGRQIPLKTRSQSEVGSDPVGRCSLTSSLSAVDASTITDGDRLAYRARQHSLGPGRHKLLLACLPSLRSPGPHVATVPGMSGDVTNQKQH